MGVVSVGASFYSPVLADPPNRGNSDCTVASPATSSTVDENGREGRPAGNDGTIKIDGCSLDPGPGDNGPGSPDNEPHVACLFAVDWYNYDEGELYSSVLFEAWPPTGNGEDLASVVVSGRDPADGSDAFGTDGRVFIGEDDASGGDEDGLDASVVYDLSAALAAFTPHHSQGWHVKVTINADGSQGADVKHKVFWLEPCAPPTTVAPTTTTIATTTTVFVPPPSTTTTTIAGVVIESTTTTEAPTTTTTLAPTTTAPPTTLGAAVLGVEFERPAPELPRTGAGSLRLLVIGSACLALGTVALLAGRERERRLQ